MGVLKIVATDGNTEAAAAVADVRRAYTNYQRVLGVGDWVDIAHASEVLYLAIGRLAALARNASVTR